MEVINGSYHVNEVDGQNPNQISYRGLKHSITNIVLILMVMILPCLIIILNMTVQQYLEWDGGAVM
jgi:hypothetical protein